jgi:hypothetical protein
LFSAYGKMISLGTKVRMPSTSSSSPVISKDGNNLTPMSAASKSKSKGSNKFDPSFHAQRAMDLQPLLTALCERSDVFGLTKFMRWLYFEKRKDTLLLTIFQRALQRTLDCYNLTQPVYANNMIDALTWLMFLRISHIWDKLRKGIHFLAVRAVQDLILKAIRPLDDMILHLNAMATHIHQTLKFHPVHFLRPKETLDTMITHAYKHTFAAYELPINNMLSVVSNEFQPILLRIGSSIRNKFNVMAKLAYTNIINDGDELSVTALVTETDSLFELCRDELLPLIETSLVSLHQNLNGKFNSPALQTSFSALADITPVIPRLLDAMLPQQAILDFFLRILKMRHAVEAIEIGLDEHSLNMLMNELETEFEREIEKVETNIGLRARTLHAHIRRLYTSCFALSVPIGDAMMKYGAMWGKYLRKFSRLATDLISSQQKCLAPVGWIPSTRDCIVLALQQSNDFLAEKSIKVSRSLLHNALNALFEPLTISLTNQISGLVLENVMNTLNTHLVPTVPQFTPTLNGTATPNEHPLSEIIDSLSYLNSKTKELFSESLEISLKSTIFDPLLKTWNDAHSDTIIDKDDQQQRSRLDCLYQRLMSEMQKLEMDSEMKRESFLEDRRATIAGVMMPLSVSFNTSSSSFSSSSSSSHSTVGGMVIKTADTKKDSSKAQPAPFSESPVAKLMGRLTIEGSSDTQESSGSTSQQYDDKKLRKDLPMLSRISEQGGAKASGNDDGQSNPDAPALIFDFEIAQDGNKQEALATASGVWAAASAARTFYRGRVQSRRVYYEVPTGNDTEISSTQNLDGAVNPSMATGSAQNKIASTDGSISKNSLSPPIPGSPETRSVPRRPTLNARPSRGSNANSSSNPASKSNSSPNSPNTTPAKSRASLAMTPTSSSPFQSSTPMATSIVPPISVSSSSSSSSLTPVAADTKTEPTNVEHKRWTQPCRPSHSIENGSELRNIARGTSSIPSETGKATISPTISPSSSEVSIHTTSTSTSSSSPTLTPTSSSDQLPQNTAPLGTSTPQFTIPGASIRLRPRASKQ